MSSKAKIITLGTTILVLALAALFFFRFCFVFGEGVKAGQLNQIVYKGYIFKTYEGRLIQAGFRGQGSGAGIQSNEFNFSVVDKAVADSLMRCSGKTVELHYKEFLGALPWRGVQKYIVDDILSVEKADNTTVVPIVGDGGE